MLEILNVPDLRSRVAPVTIERYHRMIELGVFEGWDVELLNGVLVEKRSKSKLHFYLVQYLFQQLSRFCPPSEFLIGKEDPITIGDSEPEPDISVIEGQLSQFRHAKPTTARFVVEVAITSLAVDRAKAADDAKAGIPEYWIVRPEDGLTEIYRGVAKDDGGYTERSEVPASAVIECAALPGFSFRLAEALQP